MSALRIDPEQKFSCSQCGRCCHRFQVVVSDSEVDHYRKRNAAAWFRGADGLEGDGGDLSTEAQRAKVEPFEPLPGRPGYFRIRQRADGACGFLSAANRCRIHEELGAARKPLTCRVFPYSFHPAADAVVVTASFGCPSIVTNQGQPIAAGDSLIAIESLRKEWFAAIAPEAAPLELVAGRKMDTRSARILREGLLAMLAKDSADIRDDIRRIANTLDDLTRRRVLALPDADFAEYVSLTVPHAVSSGAAPPAGKSGAIARLLQYGFLYAVTAVRCELEEPGQSRWGLRLRRLQLLAHFHGLAPGRDRVDVGALRRQRVNLNHPGIRPLAVHYLRSHLHTLGASGRPLVDELALAMAHLNAAMALAAMNADAAGAAVDGTFFRDALMEVSDVSRARNVLLDWALNRFSGGTEAVHYLASTSSARSAD